MRRRGTVLRPVAWGRGQTGGVGQARDRNFSTGVRLMTWDRRETGGV